MEIKVIVVSIVTLCVTGLVIYRVYVNEIKPAEICEDGEKCVRFCCFDEKSCNDDEYFKIHGILQNHTEDLSQEFKILKGLECEFTEAVASWKFLEVFFVDFLGIDCK